jgi:hypothetical protein
MSHEQRIEALRARLAGVESVDISALHGAPKVLGLTAVTEPAVEPAAVAREREFLTEYFEELVATLSTAGVAEPEREAAKITTTCARNARFLWVSLRSALEGRPELLAQLPEGRGVVDSLPLGPASVVVRRGTVVRQGAFEGGHGV